MPGDSRSTTYLRMDEHHHRIELRNGGSDNLEVIGWEVPDAATLHAVAQRLETRACGCGAARATRRTTPRGRADRVRGPRGIRTRSTTGSPQPEAVPAVAGDQRFQDREHGPRPPGRPSARPGSKLQVLHGLLGFRVSDVVGPAGNPMGVFLHCNPRHHSIALFGAGGAHKRINHFMLECNSLDDVGSARDTARRQGTPIVIDLGRHMNDHIVSFYVANPSQFAIEYGWGGRTIDESCWQVGRYDSVESIWGHPELTELAARWHARSRPPATDGHGARRRSRGRAGPPHGAGEAGAAPSVGRRHRAVGARRFDRHACPAPNPRGEQVLAASATQPSPRPDSRSGRPGPPCNTCRSPYRWRPESSRRAGAAPARPAPDHAPGRCGYSG